MVRTTITPVTSAASGTLINAATSVDSTNGNQFANPTGRAIIEITNGAAANVNVMFTTSGTYVAGGVTYAISDINSILVNGTTRVYGPFDKTLFNDGSGNVLVDFSSGTTITARVIEVGAG